MIAYDKENKRFNYRVVSIAINNGRVLISKANGELFCTFPGEHAEFSEPAA